MAQVGDLHGGCQRVLLDGSYVFEVGDAGVVGECRDSFYLLAGEAFFCQVVECPVGILNHIVEQGNDGCVFGLHGFGHMDGVADVGLPCLVGLAGMGLGGYFQRAQGRFGFKHDGPFPGNDASVSLCCDWYTRLVAYFGHDVGF